MTKQEHKLKSMLNYYEVNLSGGHDERMSKKELNKFLDNLNQIYDFYTLQEIMKKIKDKRKEELDEDEDRDDFMFPPKEEDQTEKDTFENEMMKNPEDFFGKKDIDGKNKNFNDPIDTDINKFLKWLTMLLYSGDHSVIITEDKTGINIRLVKINKGKK
jgi:predicted nucleic acid-binding protein